MTAFWGALALMILILALGGGATGEPPMWLLYVLLGAIAVLLVLLGICEWERRERDR